LHRRFVDEREVVGFLVFVVGVSVGTPHSWAIYSIHINIITADDSDHCSGRYHGRVVDFVAVPIRV
jgi:hypothetical protein